MRRGFSLLTLGIGWVLLATASCGKDEATTTTGGHVGYCKQCSSSSDCASGNVCRQVTGAFNVCAATKDTSCCDGPEGMGGHCYDSLGPKVDGSGGSAGGGIIGGAGKAGKGGGAGKGGSGGTGGTTQGSNLGRACVNDTDCADPKLTCIASDGLSGDGPAKGMCTAACTSSSQCLDLADNSFCIPFTSSGDMYCVEGCTEGDAPKCHERDEVACSLIGLIPSGTACQSTTDCSSNELCDSQTSECGQIVTGCVPTCGGDYDCSSGQFCDFSSGFCTAMKPSGLPLGSPCKVPASGQTDPCNGFCLAGSQDQTKGECSALCSLNSTLTGCGWDGTGAADNACIFATVLSSGTPALGDVGICGKLCDCNADCTLKGDYCIDETMGDVQMVWGRPGYCRPLQATESASDSFSKCPPGHSGGAGGMGGTGGTGGSGGMAGEAGQSGANNSSGTGGSSSGTGGESGAGAGGQGSK